ncbi:hypothetical protein [Holophaga foetida]|uniref:hypothetical protein n=1 Tax=Holophaga foetida TaxID=35839 RepID=UPI0002474A3F|nr:hypothetical protein [Holophaga foetida]
MSEANQTKGHPTWFMGGVLVLLTLLVGLTWLNGALLNRQQHQLESMREDIQCLTDSLEQALSDGEAEGGIVPSSLSSAPRRFLRVQQQDDGSEQAMKDLKESRDSATKAVREARDVQRKVSIEENARLADERAKREAAERWWRPWLYGTLGLAFLAVVLRAWVRRRG